LSVGFKIQIQCSDGPENSRSYVAKPPARKRLDLVSVSKQEVTVNWVEHAAPLVGTITI
jgi:hypothetical protein